MAARAMEAAQKARRSTDYDSEDDDGERSEIGLLTGSISSSSNLHQRSQPTGSHPLSSSMISSSFDPYASTPTQSPGVLSPSQEDYPPSHRDNSLFDDGSVHTVDTENQNNNYHTNHTTSSIPGAAGYLEMEEEPPRRILSENEPITTSSGLLLTHRRHSPTAAAARRHPPTTTGSSTTPPAHSPQNHMKTVFDKSDPLARNSNSGFRTIRKDYFEVEHGFHGWKAAQEPDFHGNSPRRHHSMPMLQARRFLSYVRIWMVISAVFLMLATGVLFHSFGHTETAGSLVVKSGSNTDATVNVASGVASNLGRGMNQIILVPMEGISERQQFVGQQQQQQLYYQVPSGQIGYHTHYYQSQGQQHQHGVRRVLLELRQEFEDWVVHHKKQYHSEEEKERRFQVWSDNHHRTIEKNRRHGPCKLTNQAVFGSNHFKDLSPEEFKAQYLTGYTGPRQDELDTKHRQMSSQMRQSSQHRGKTLKPGLHHSNMHESIKQRILQDHGHRLLKQQTKSNKYTMRNANCDWYDISCMLRWLWDEAGIQFGSIVGTMEPRYDADAYPNSIDWRDYGVVTDVRSQGDCGACWAITAVETAESAHAIATGHLYDLSETEVIVCETNCEMCSGGWPQNAFEYVMNHGGLPLYNTLPYDGETLFSMTQGLDDNERALSYSTYSGSSWTKNSLEQYRSKMCPANSEGDSQDSEDTYWNDGADNKDYGDYSDQGRYGNIKGYGYATDRCICYSDGSGCDCSNQDEALAVANIASHGPATACLEASLWQDYSGGIMTSDTGCSSQFMDVNHCVQVVGYAYTGSSNDDEAEGDKNDRDRQEDEGESSSQRNGYWIVRNQWGGYWGMNGYAYVAMGANTCGILNDMTQAYL